VQLNGGTITVAFSAGVGTNNYRSFKLKLTFNGDSVSCQTLTASSGHSKLSGGGGGQLANFVGKPQGL
jgi:hypothetical protein